MADVISEPSGPPAAPPTPTRSLEPDAWRELGEVIWLSFPIIITMLSYTVMNFLDVVMVGWHSAAELAAVGPAASSFFLIASLMMATLSITNTFVGQSVGRGEKREAPGYVWQAMYLAAAWGVVAWSLAPLAPRLFAWAGHEPGVQLHEVGYFRYMLLRVPALGFWISLSAFYQATRRPVIPMIAGLIGNVFNLAANYALIFGRWGFPEMGIVGAAVATVVATYFQAGVLAVVFLAGPTHREYGSRDSAAVDLRKLWRVVRYGLPAGLTWFLENAGWTLFLLRIVGEYGQPALAANNATMQIMQLAFMPVIGLNIGVQALVGQHIGMRDFEGAKRRTYLALALAVAFMAAAGAGFLLFRHPLIALFCRGEAGDEVARIGSMMLVFAAVFQAFNAVNIVSTGALRGAGDTLFTMGASVICSWFVFIPLALLFSRGLGMGVRGAWLGTTIYIILVSIVMFTRFASGAWRRIDLFRERRAFPSPDTSAAD